MPTQANIDVLSSQRASALKLHIIPVEVGQEAALASTIAKILGDIISSYESFLLAEFLKNSTFEAAFDLNPHVFDSIKQNLALRAVDLNFASCDVLLAPTLSEDTPELFNNEVREWEREIFSVYRDEIINTDLNNTVVMERISERYTPKQRADIFRPIMSMIGDGSKYTIDVGKGNLAEKRLRKPNKEVIRVYVPKMPLDSIEAPNEKNVVAYLQVRTNDEGTLDFSRKGIRHVYYVEETEKDVYPYRPDSLRYDGYVFILNRKLLTQIVFEEGLFFINSEELDMTVWGESREGAEEAFAFAFYSLYLNYCMEEDENLSVGGQTMKIFLQSLIQSTVQQ